jgi:hypothetical protein
MLRRRNAPRRSTCGRRDDPFSLAVPSFYALLPIVSPNNHNRPARILLSAGGIVAVALGLTCLAARGESPSAQPEEPAAPVPLLLDDMDGAEPMLRLAEAAPGVQIVRQAIEAGEGADGVAEHVTMAISPSGAALAYQLPQAAAIAEFRLEAWAWCNRPGMQLGAVVVLPRSTDPATGKDRELILRSGATAGGGNWQQLTMDGIPSLLERHARVARMQYGGGIEERGAYISHLVLLVPGGTGPTEVWLDKVALYGELRPVDGAAQGEGPIDLAAAWSDGAASPANGGASRREPPPVPRIIRWQGEPLESLQRLGFDAVWMGRLASAAELAEASRLGLWLVCPPPTLEALQSGGLGSEYNGVMAWDLGVLADEADLAFAQEWARTLQRHELVHDRPTLLRPMAMPREASRVADIMVLGRPTFGATATWLEHATWLGREKRQARAGTAAWSLIDTHRSDKAIAQVATLRGGHAATGAASYEHLCRAIGAAAGCWPRGYMFESASSLASNDADARMRSRALELINLRLGLIEPWLARGKVATSVQSSRADVSAMVLTVERSHLVLPVLWNIEGRATATLHRQQPGPLQDGRYVDQGVPIDESATFVLPGVPEACDAYLLTIGGPRQLVTRRVTGGLSVTVEQLPEDGLLLLTEDGYAFSQINRYLRMYAPRAARVRVELAALRWKQASAAAKQLSPALLQATDATRELGVIDAAIGAAGRSLAASDFAAAFARAAVAEQALEVLHARIAAAIWPDDAAGARPLRDDWSALPDLEQVAAVTAHSPQPATLWPGGDFEDLDALLALGWHRSNEMIAGAASAVRLSPDNPHDGKYSLELTATAEEDVSAPPLLPTAPVWITSPPVPASAGQLVEITGWVRILETPLGAADPVLIFDSLGGEESALRITSAPLWQPFRLVRAVPPGAECRVTVALGGLGRVAVDDVGYRFLPLPARGPVARR